MFKWNDVGYVFGLAILIFLVGLMVIIFSSTFIKLLADIVGRLFHRADSLITMRFNQDGDLYLSTKASRATGRTVSMSYIEYNYYLFNIKTGKHKIVKPIKTKKISGEKSETIHGFISNQKMKKSKDDLFSITDSAHKIVVVGFERFFGLDNGLLVSCFNFKNQLIWKKRV